jgi:hypothetical protein
VLVTPTGTGQFALLTDPYDRGTMGGMRGGGTPAAGPITLARLISSGAPAPTPALPLDRAQQRPLAHPFHLHAWPFTVLATSDATPVAGVPQDVVLVPPGDWARLRIPFTHQTGRTVYHCHILDHEDLGMMATIDVQ